ncbi:MAG: tetratricopeptide repeat protein [Anaerolineae bacterium]
MVKTRLWRFALVFIAAFLGLALIQPTQASFGIALIALGSAIATLVAWGAVSVFEAIQHPREAKPAEPDTASPQPQKPEAPVATPSGAADAVEAARKDAALVPEVVRDRLRVLVATPSPVLGDDTAELARVSWARLVDALAAGKPDIEIESVWPPTLANLQHHLERRPRFHIVILEAPVTESGIVFEDQHGRPEIVSPRQVSASLLAERVKLLVVRSANGVELPLDQLKTGADTAVAVGAIRPGLWVPFAAALVNALASGDVTGRAFAAAMSTIENESIDSRDRPQILGSNWHSLVDRGTDRRGLRTLRAPMATGLRLQPWFRDRGETLSRLLALLSADAVSVGVVSPAGGGAAPLAIEAGHRLASQYDHVLYVDCGAQRGSVSADTVLMRLAVQLRCRVGRELLLADAVLGPLQKRRVLAILDNADLLPSVDRERLVGLAAASPSGCRLVFASRQPLEEVQPQVAVGPMAADGVGAWLAWLADHAGFPALTDISEESVRALTAGVQGNPLAIRVAVGLSDYLGLLQSIRTARDTGSLEDLVGIARQRLGQREVETLAVLAQLPSPLPLDVIGAVLGRDANNSLLRLERSGFLVDWDRPGLYLLHPYVRELVEPTLPLNDRLPGKITGALANKAKSLAGAIRTSEDREEVARALSEVEDLLDTFSRVVTWAAAESGPAAGRMDAVRDITLALAPALRHFGLTFEALRLSQLGEEAARRLEDYGARGYLLIEAAENQREHGDIDAAAVSYDEAARSLELAKDYRRVADVLIRLGAMRWETGSPAAARGPFERAYEWLERLQDRTGQVSALMVLGHIAAQERPATAVALYQKALSVAQLGSDVKQQAQARYAVARCHTASGEHAAAADEYAKALESFTAAGDTEGRLQAYRGLGQAYLTLDDRERAVQVLERAAELEERTTGSSDAAMDLGRAYLRDRRWTEALDFQKRSLARASTAHDKRAMATAHNGLGSVHLEMGAKAEAVQQYETAASLWKEIGDDAGLARTYNNIAIAYRRAGRWDRARQYLDEAAKLLTKTGDKDALARVYNNLGSVHAAQREKKEAAKFYERSLALKQELGDLYGANITKANLTLLSQRD